ncbi:MAG: 4-alpha-glucanotransferase [Candidatus Coprenecus sp.]
MTFYFSIHYRTEYGERIFITGSIPELGNNDISKAIALNYTEGSVWKATVKATHLKQKSFTYRYIIKNDNGGIISEVGSPRKMSTKLNTGEIFLHDSWHGRDDISPMLTTPFTDIFYPAGKENSTTLGKFATETIIKVTVPAIKKGREVAICGNIPELGSWNPAKAPAMQPVSGSAWVIHLDASKISKDLEFKFITRNTLTKEEAIWEDSANRRISIPLTSENQTHLFEYSGAAFALARPKFFGTAIPVFSLKSATSCGIGDFSDLRPFADWISLTGQNIIQILPINDTTSTGTWTDSYPYGGISVNALHPIYINIPEIGKFKTKKALAEYEKGRKELESKDSVDYEAVLKFKMKYLRIQFESHRATTFAEKGYKEFLDRNTEWLLPYCSFCLLRDKFGTPDFSKWEEYSVYDPERVKDLDIDFHLFVQYHLHKQLVKSVEYMHSKGIALKGDIPIGITPLSADAWADPRLFNSSSQAGAPPDDFSVEGQNWGFPTYNWDIMREDGYRWWKNRFTKMSEYFDAYRIDHVLGFFRIWEIPSTQVNGLMGHFSPALPFSYEELRCFGFRFDYHRHATPYIRYYQVKEMFADRSAYVIQTFLQSNQYEVFTLREEFNTQKKLELWFKDKNDDALMKGLMALVGEVLFIEDENQMGMYHPRISAQNTYSYKALSQEEKNAYNQLYNHYFYERHNGFWWESAMKKLPEIIGATGMLTCAEDLGMIPACVPDVMSRLRMLSLEIQRMPKDPHQRFANPAHYPYLSVCTTGTHDTSTLRGWWEEDRNISQKYYNEVLCEQGAAPYFCEPWVCEKIVNSHIHSSSMLVILPFADWLSTDGSIRATNPESERINIPANPKHYWKYRMHIPIEELHDSKDFNSKLTAMILAGKRD